MIHAIDTANKPRMGVRCTCGAKFAVPKALDEHIIKENQAMETETPPEYRQTEEEIKTIAGQQESSPDAAESGTVAKTEPATHEPKTIMKHNAPDPVARIATALEAKLYRLAELRKEIAELSPLKAAMDELKFEITLEMQKAQSKRTDPVAGIYAIRATRTTVHINEPGVVATWLEDNLFDTTEYYKLDEVRIKALAEEKLKTTGEIVPGLEAVETEYLTVKESK